MASGTGHEQYNLCKLSPLVFFSFFVVVVNLLELTHLYTLGGNLLSQNIQSVMI